MDKQPNKVTIVIPVYNGVKYLQHTINSILDTTKHPNYKIVIVESESTDGAHEYVKFLEKTNDKIRVIYTKREGITRAINRGIEFSDKDSDILLTQNDVIFPKLMGSDWLISMCLACADGVGLVTCLNGLGMSGSDYLDKLVFVGTWYMYIPRKTIELIGLFDESYNPGPGDDIDYSFRVKKAGLRIGIVEFAVDHHRLTENYNDNSELCQRGAEYFRRKYGIPNPK